MGKKNQDPRTPAALRLGIISIVFMVIGYEVSIFVHEAAVSRVESLRDTPDTVFVAVPSPPDASSEASRPVVEHVLPAGPDRQWNKPSAHSERAQKMASAAISKTASASRPEPPLFRFDPNSISEDGLVSLGFSRKQAASIVRYRQSGGRFRRPGDFARCYVVSDSLYRKLEPYIDIPLLDINAADSAAFDALPGIGGWFASRMVSYRKELGGYSYPEQLMDIRNFDRERYDGLKDLIRVGDARPFDLWGLPEDSLAAHPYIGKYAAHSVVLYRDNVPRQDWTVEKMAAAGVLEPDAASRLSRCRIKPAAP